MPVLVGRIRGDAAKRARDRDLLRRFRRYGNKPRISVAGGGRASHCVGSASHQPESTGDRDRRATGRHLGRRRFDGKEEAPLSTSTSRIRTSDARSATTTTTACRGGRTTGAV